MIIAQISDTHVALDAPDTDQRLQDFERVIADINTLDPQPDLIVHTGDIVHNGLADEYALSAAILSRARAPVFVLAGNKDDRTNLLSSFLGAGYLEPGAPFIDYAIEDFPLRIIALDTLSEGNNKGDFCKERAQRFAGLLERDPDRPAVVCSHHPPFRVPVGPDPVNFVTQDSMERLAGAIAQAGQIVAVLSGHVHRLTGGTVGTTPAIVTTSIATTLRKGEYPAEMEGRPVYYLHRHDPARGFASEVRIAT
ncbi:MAG: metallophosphoesterase [Hyphomicrobiales bacterium]